MRGSIAEPRSRGIPPRPLLATALVAILLLAGSAVVVAWRADMHIRERVARRALAHASTDLADAASRVAADLETLTSIVDRLLVRTDRTPAGVQQEFAEIASSLPSARRGWLVAATVADDAFGFAWNAGGDTEALPAIAQRVRGWRVEGRVDATRLARDALARAAGGELAIAVQGPGLAGWLRASPSAGGRTPDFAHARWTAEARTPLGTFRLAAVPLPGFFSLRRLALTALTAGGALVTLLLVGLLLLAEQRALHLAQERKRIARAILDAIPTPLSFLDEQGHYVEFNRALAQLTGRSFPELKHAHVADVWGRRAWERDIRPCFERALAGEVTEHEFRHRGPDGEERDWLGTFMPWRDAEGAHHRGVIVITRDITDQKRFERERAEQARRATIARRWEDLGMLAGGIAHDLNNLLTVVLGALEQARGVAVRSDVARTLDEAIEAAQTAGRLTHRLLAYAGRGRRETARIHPAEVVREAARLLHMAAPPDLAVEADAPEQAPLVSGDRAQLVQAVFNLGLNAVQAITEHGRGTRVRIGTRTAEGPDCAALPWQAHGLEPPARAVAFVVEDDGPGVPPEVRERLFTPFFTTRGQGTGLGLAVVFGAARAHRGFVELDDDHRPGARFVVWLPALDVQADAPDPEEAAPAAPARPVSPRGKALVVDDDPLVRHTTARMLAHWGWPVVEAGDGVEALETLAREPEVALVVMDVRMPRMDGIRALAEIRRHHAGVPVILVSGASSRPPEADAHPDAWLDKPFTSEALRDALARVFRG